ncbi:hypothetical protein FTX61_17670 [Nitriliruptoraceae bacterium ZYF776]|nr:hypothetical protein [Profundirhabdus halotolerans]
MAKRRRKGGASRGAGAGGAKRPSPPPSDRAATSADKTSLSSDDTASTPGTPARAATRESAGPELADQPAGRKLLSVLVSLVLAVMLISNLPSSELTDQLGRFEQPVTDLTGLSQNWALFAPNPRSTTLRLRAELEHVDGTVTEWLPPTANRIVGVYGSYRWRKWASAVAVTSRTGLHRQTVSYLLGWADEELTDLPPVAEVRLYRGVARAGAPGSGEPLDLDPVFEEELLLRSVVGEEGA